MKSNVSLLRRLGAIVYDVFLAFSLVFFIGMMIIAVFGEIGDLFLYLVTLPSTYLYFTLSWVKGRQTIGMKAWKFQVIQHNNQNITHRQAFVRFILGLVSFMAFGLGFAYQFFNKERLCWHDKISDTLLTKN
ncbi:RDD family protein [Candidatus Thioglobus sp.]|uniref:RDD family protein n=1 Tax=Candidatus Thioglobus sp. TaxID=2026721 RepID=UPI00262653C7|nr:RDD family protein [Candidatus Thioglobus sp.]MDG2395198.1 RDD family protein [Candidatus Thioglobus sp.]